MRVCCLLCAGCWLFIVVRCVLRVARTLVDYECSLFVAVCGYVLCVG